MKNFVVKPEEYYILYDVKSALKRLQIRFEDNFGPLKKKRGIELLASIDFDYPVLAYVEEVAKKIDEKYKDGVTSYVLLVAKFMNLVTEPSIEGYDVALGEVLKDIDQLPAYYGGGATEWYLSDKPSFSQGCVDAVKRSGTTDVIRSPVMRASAIFMMLFKYYFHALLHISYPGQQFEEKLKAFSDGRKAYLVQNPKLVNVLGFDPSKGDVRPMTDVVDNKDLKKAILVYVIETAKTILANPLRYYSSSGLLDKTLIQEIDQLVNNFQNWEQYKLKKN